MALPQLRDACPGISLIEPSSPVYAATRTIFQQSNTATPIAIARPKSSQEVSQLVKAAVKYDIKITVRSGGHDLVGRSIVQDALTIDLRDINFVQVHQDKQSAKIGGGASMLQVASGLEDHGLVTPIGSVPSVGYVGWSTLGGYGSLANHFGLGVDQIIGAEVVNWEGNLVDADSDLLKGIRGAGGNFGVICSLTVKVYPVSSVLSGSLLFKPRNLAATFQQCYKVVQSGLDAIPSELQIQPMIVNIPTMGKIVGINFTWSSSDLSKGRHVLEQLLSMFPEVIVNTVQEISLSQSLLEADKMVPHAVYGFSQTVSFQTFDDDVLEVIGHLGEAMPSDPSNMLSFHSLWSVSPSADSTLDRNSVFSANISHTVVEIIGLVVDPAIEEEAKAWVIACQDKLRSTGKSMERTYVSLTSPGDRSLQQVYGDKWAKLLLLKDKFDPHGVFDLAVPRIRTGST